MRHDRVRRLVRWWTGEGDEQRLVGVHATHSAANSALNTALLGTVVLALDPGTQLDRLLGYLVFTLAPFALAAPLIGWAVPRCGVGARRLLAWSMGVRAVLALTLAAAVSVASSAPGLAYALAFAVLVAQRVHTVTLYGAVPTVVGGGTRRLHANARLNRAAATAGAVGGGVGAVLVAGVGPAAALLVAAVGYALGIRFVAAVAHLSAGSAAEGRPRKERPGTQAGSVAGLRPAAVAFGGTRAAAGALTAAFAGALATRTSPPVVVALVATALAVGGIIGSVAGPYVLDRRGHAEVLRFIGGAFAATAVVPLAAGATAPLHPAHPVTVAITAVVAAVAAAVAGLTGSFARQVRDDRIQQLAHGGGGDVAVHLAFVRWDALAQVGWVGCAIAVTALRLGIGSAFVLVACLGAVTAAAMLLTGPRNPSAVAPSRIAPTPATGTS